MTIIDMALEESIPDDCECVDCGIFDPGGSACEECGDWLCVMCVEHIHAEDINVCQCCFDINGYGI